MNIAAPISGTENHRSRWQRLINPVDPKPWHPIAWYVSSVIGMFVVPTILFVLLLFAVAGINYVTGLENGYLLAGAGGLRVGVPRRGVAICILAGAPIARCFPQITGYFDDRSIHNMGDFFGATAAIGTFIAVLVAAISSTGCVIGRTTIRASG